MDKRKIISIVGARPNFIKVAALNREMISKSTIKHIIIHTGQHYDENMSSVFFERMEIPKADYNLGIKELPHAAMTGQMLEKIEKVLVAERPDLVIIYGDCNTTLAGALAAVKLHIPVAHIEAGMRSFNMTMPEEVNRILSDRISSILFCSTDLAVSNLEKEGFGNFSCKIVMCGDVMLDAAQYYRNISSEKSTIVKDLSLDKFIICTMHRAENTDVLKNAVSILNALQKINSEIPIVFPVHPRTRKIMDINKIRLNIKIIDPVDYFDMIELLKNCSLVMTDSGGLQKEAFFFHKHCVTFRNETEWVELVQNGFNEVAGVDTDGIYEAYKKMISKKSNFNINLYGDGKASKKIVEELMNYNLNKPC